MVTGETTHFLGKGLQMRSRLGAIPGASCGVLFCFVGVISVALRSCEFQRKSSGEN